MRDVNSVAMRRGDGTSRIARNVHRTRCRKSMKVGGLRAGGGRNVGDVQFSEVLGKKDALGCETIQACVLGGVYEVERE